MRTTLPWPFHCPRHLVPHKPVETSKRQMNLLESRKGPLIAKGTPSRDQTAGSRRVSATKAGNFPRWQVRGQVVKAPVRRTSSRRDHLLFQHLGQRSHRGGAGPLALDLGNCSVRVIPNGNGLSLPGRIGHFADKQTITTERQKS
jgi:hypothetical protein